MNSYLVERYLPGLSEAEVRAGLRRAESACADLRATGTEINYVGSIFLPLEEACFCRFDSDRPEAVAAANERAQLAFARITAGVAIDADDGGALEGAVAPERAVAPEGGGV